MPGRQAELRRRRRRRRRRRLSGQEAAGALTGNFPLRSVLSTQTSLYHLKCTWLDRRGSDPVSRSWLSIFTRRQLVTEDNSTFFLFYRINFGINDIFLPLTHRTWGWTRCFTCSPSCWPGSVRVSGTRSPVSRRAREQPADTGTCSSCGHLRVGPCYGTRAEL